MTTLRIWSWKPGGAASGAALLAVAIGLILAAGTCVLAHDPDPRVLPPNLAPMGKSYGDWGAAWWQWALSIPKAENPILDPTGALGHVGQSGPVWFLAGTFGGFAERTCIVPAGKAIFFPIVDGTWWAPDDIPLAKDIATMLGKNPATMSDEELIRLVVNWQIDHAAPIFCTVDGVPIDGLESYRAQSSPFDVNLSDLVADWGYTPGPAGPAVADGYWVMLAPLEAGPHEIHFKGGLTFTEPGFEGWTFTTEMLYHLTVDAGPNDAILPPDLMVGGMSYGEWGAKWWQWAYSIPVADNPLFDETGAKAGTAQSGPVYFLAGVINVSGTAERTITVPAGKALFFPILNVETDNVGVDPPNTVEQLYGWADFYIRSITDIHANLDGKPVVNAFDYRGTSPASFSYDLPATDNIYQYFGMDISGTVDPAVSDGHWLMLAPLSPGRHRLEFGGTYGDPINFTLNIIYHINVEDGPNGVVLPSDLAVGGMTYGEWGAEWWQWALSLPVTGHPLFDDTGANAANGQSGPVWFLGGTFTVLEEKPGEIVGRVTREFTMPYGKAIFFPILNVETDSVGIDPPPTPAELAAWAATNIDHVTEVRASVDGVPLENLGAARAASPEPFAFTLPDADNLYQFFGVDVKGTIEPAMSDGYWVMLKPLPPGEHTIKFYGKLDMSAEGGMIFIQDITHIVTVLPEVVAPSPLILPWQFQALGMTYAGWSAKWWQWALAQPADVNPIEDPDGRFSANGQSGPVWFLAGTSGWMAERAVTIPAGKAIFFPIINNIWITIPDNPNYPGGDPPFTVPGAEEAARAALAAPPWGMDAADILECELDGTSLAITPEYRAKSTVFTADLPIDAWAFAPYIDHAGAYPDSVADGYWVMLAPLPPGKHSIHFRGGSTQSGFVTEVTFDVTVLPFESPSLQAVAYKWGPMPAWRWLPGFKFQGTMYAKFANVGEGAAYGVTAQITRTPSNTVATDPFVALGDILAGTSAWSADTFTTVTDMTRFGDPRAGVTWTARYEDALGFRHVQGGIPQFPKK